MPRKKRDKAGNMRKEPIKKYTERFMGDKKMNEEFPDRGQRFAVALSYARKFYSDAAVDKAYPPKSNPIGPFKKKEKPSPAVLQGVSLYREIAGDNADGWADNPEVGADIDWGYMEELFPLAKYLEGTLSINYYDIHDIKLKDFDTLKEAVDSQDDYDTINEGFSKGAPSKAVNFTVGFTKRNLKRFQKLLDDPQRVPPKPKPVKPTPAIGKKIIAWYNAFIKALEEYDPDDLEYTFAIPKIMHFDKYMSSGGYTILTPYDYDAMKGMFAVLKQVGYEPYQQDDGEAITWKDFIKQGSPRGKQWYWNMRNGSYLLVDEAGYEKLTGYLQYLADEGKINGRTAHYTYKDGTSAGWRFQFNFNEVKDNPRSNPHTPVSEAKSFYKQFHQKPAKNVKKTKVDIGDTWVGLGKAWSIGYRSGKETGNEQQKYIHNFGVDEESGKKFKEPELYYVKNNDGSQMMVIMGGDWYIDVAEDGSMSWIYI